MELSTAEKVVFERLKRLDEFLNQHNYKPMLLFSGGKDSLVLLDLCYRYFGSDLYICYIHVNDNTHELCDYYVDYYVDYYLNAVRRFYFLYRIEKVRVHGSYVEPSFPKILLEYGFPLPSYKRFCQRIFKEDLLRTLPDYFVFISALKINDSTTRRIYLSKLDKTFPMIIPKKLFKTPRDYHYDYCPILDWTNDHIFKYIKKYNLKLNCLYNIIGHSGNCMICPKFFNSVERCYNYLIKLRDHFPHWFRNIVNTLINFMIMHRTYVRCSRDFSDCPFKNLKNRYIFAKNIGKVLELFNIYTSRFVRSFEKS